MKIRIIAIGKIKEKYFVDAISEYTKRINRYCDFEIVELQEANPNKSVEEQKQIESKRLLEKAQGYVIALDLNGKKLTSPKLSELISQKAIDGISEISFLIGGSNGHSEELLNKVDYKLSFSDLTFPHQLFRVMLSEQIYRAFCIMNNTPYHK